MRFLRQSLRMQLTSVAFGCFLLMSVTPPLFAEIVSEEMKSRTEFLTRFIQNLEPDQKRQERTAFGLGLSLPVWRRLSVESKIYWSPDMTTQPRALQVRNAWGGILAGIKESYPLLFRWFIATGLVFQYEETQIVFQDAETNQSFRTSRQKVFPYVRLGMDYAIDSAFEVTFELGLQKPQDANQYDWFWGLALGYNLNQ